MLVYMMDSADGVGRRVGTGEDGNEGDGLKLV